jgi:hypothetical protein
VNPLLLHAIKALNGGLFVAGFALVGEMLEPKRFAGLFSAAPSVALANLIVVIGAQGDQEAIADTRGMAVGAIAFALSAVAGVALVRRYRATRGAALVAATWLLISAVGYLGVLA